MNSQKSELQKRLKRFVYETAAMKGRRVERAVMAQFRVTATDAPIGAGVDMNYYKLPQPKNSLTDAQDVTGVEKSSNSFSNKRVSPQATGNFISSIHAEDNIDACLKTLSGTIEIDVGTDIGGYTMRRKGKSVDRRMGHNVNVPHTKKAKYRKALDEYPNSIPDPDIVHPWYQNWDKIVKSNLKRII